MRLAAVGHHNDINKLMFQLAKNRKSMKTSGPSVAKIFCVIHHGPFVCRVERVSGAVVREKATWLYKQGTVFFFYHVLYAVGSSNPLFPLGWTFIHCGFTICKIFKEHNPHK